MDEVNDVGSRSTDGAGEVPHQGVSVRRSLWARVGLILLVAVGAALMASVLVVRTVVLDADTYTKAMAENRAYDRLYTEVLADPELADLFDAMLGDLAVVSVSPTQVRAKATATLRLTLPPARLQKGTEAAIENVLAYVRGDTDQLEFTFDAAEAIDRIDDTAIREARFYLASAADEAATSMPAYRDAVIAFADQLAAGTVPDFVPKAGGTTFDPNQVIATIVGLRPDMDDETRLMVEALVLSGDDRDALITIASERVAEHARLAADRLRASTDEKFRYDVVGALAKVSGRAESEINARLDPARNAARLLGWPMFVVSALMVLSGLVGLMRLRPVDRGRAVVDVGVGLVGAAALVVVGWWLLTVAVAAPWEPAVAGGTGSWGLPGGMRAVLSDVGGSITGQLAHAVRWSAWLMLGLGVLVAIAGAAAAGVRVPWLTRRRLVVVATLGALVVVLLVVTTSHDSTPANVNGCNGHDELCDRPYDEVVYAATHNSMSSPDVVAVWPEHDAGLREQLDDGVRALLIDTHYWQPLASEQAVRALDPFITPELAGRLWREVEGLREGRAGTFLCHNHCAFGSMPFVDGLIEVREFLEDNPREVVTLIIQDAITPADTAAVMTEAGLDRYLYERALGDDWPTLGAMINDGRRLVVLAENEGSAPGWYLPGFELMQEVPFLALSPEAFTCAENRGDPTATLFLLNHWVQRIAPDRVDSVRVNTRDVLVDRARQCERERGQMPNYVAVNFHDLGDLMGAVDTLNGVAP